MAQPVRIECINKTNRTDSHERISFIGGVNPDGSRWKLSEANAIDGIKNGKWAFYVSAGSHTVNVIIAHSTAGHEYLKTEADRYQPDNLLPLPECP